MAKTPKRVSAAQAIVDRILSEPIPDKGDLRHPMQKKSSGRQMTLSEAVQERTSYPSDFNDWSLRLLVDYFAFKYQELTGSLYKKTYGSDCSTYQIVGKFFSDNGLHRYHWSKNLTDWALENRESVAKEHKYLTIQTLPKLLNTYYQEEVLPLVEEEKVERSEDPDEPFMDELQEACESLSKTEFFAKFGIPVAMTYFVNKKGAKEELIYEKLKEVIAASVTSTDGRTKVERMFISSIIGSPYPSSFKGLNWRTVLAEHTEGFERQKWWRDIDFNGNHTLPKYKLITV